MTVPKQSRGKPRWSWLPWDALTLVAELMTRGPELRGYAPRGYLDADSDQYADAAQRHLAAHFRGEWLDDSGYPHLVCAAADTLCAVAIELKNRRP